MEYGAIVGGVSGGIITVVGYIFVTKWLNKQAEKRENRREESEKLKVHFKDLAREAQGGFIPVISRLTENYGQIGSHSQAIHSEIVDPDLPQLSKSFGAHFSEEKTRLETYRQTIKEHNEDYHRFCLGIQEVFKSKGLLVLPINSNDPSPHIWDNIFHPLFKWWQDRDQGKVNPSPDFTQIQTKPDGEPNNLYVSGWGSAAVAYAETEAGREACRKVIREVAENKNFEKKAAKLTSSAKQLAKEISTWRRQLIDKLDSIDKFWPGTKSYKFKKEIKNCNNCRDIFGG